MRSTPHPTSPTDIADELRNPNPNSPYFKDYLAALRMGDLMGALHLLINRLSQKRYEQSEKEKTLRIKGLFAASVSAMQNVVEATRNLGKPITQKPIKSKDKLTSDEAKKLIETLPQEIAVLKEVQAKLQEEIKHTDEALITANKEWEAKQEHIADEFIHQIQTNPEATFVDINDQPIVLQDETLLALKAAMIRPSPSKVLAVNEALAERIFAEVPTPESVKAEDKEEWQFTKNAEFICNHDICLRTIDVTHALYDAQHKTDKPDTQVDSGIEAFDVKAFARLIFNNVNKTGFNLIAAASQQEKDNPTVVKLERSKYHAKNKLKEVAEQIFNREELLEAVQARLHHSPHP